MGRSDVSSKTFLWAATIFGGLLLIALLIVGLSGDADPVDGALHGQSAVTGIVNAAVIVFREGLEAILILAAVTASLLGARQGYRRPIAYGALGAFAVTVATWFLMQAVLNVFGAYQDILLAVTGLIAIAVLLLVMNWFFHKVYWTEWIGKHNKRKRELVSQSEVAGHAAFWGFLALGFTSVYREGFEVVLFLQNLQLAAGTGVVMKGVALGLAGTLCVGALTFIFHHRLPYKKMLMLTGILLGIVLVVMVGGTSRTLQDIGWLSTTPLGVAFPDWFARWFEVVPTVETITCQLLAGAFVIGSYYAAERVVRKRRAASVEAAAGANAAAATSAVPVPPLAPLCQPEMSVDAVAVPPTPALGRALATQPTSIGLPPQTPVVSREPQLLLPDVQPLFAAKPMFSGEPIEFAPLGFRAE
ncbi:MAG: FTR1 family protein [Thermoleophilia bacterium]|nr:FTR1 family protein [Thermoleophilia bacterium]